MGGGLLGVLVLLCGEPQVPAIVGGQAAQLCEFPTVVSLGGCSGTLVHPEIVMYAAHCGAETEAVFGEVRSTPAFTVPIDHCGLDPMGGEGAQDFAYCQLAQPVTDVPITPPLFGCELAVLEAGREAWIAGFGETGMVGGGTKHWAHTQVDAVFENWVHVGEAGIGTAVGDSGSPAFVQLDDGGWRAFGIASTGGQPGSYVRMDRAVAWVEAMSGVDITPCTDEEGAWQPTTGCGGFSADPLAGGDWASGCSAGGLSGAADTCGPPFDGAPADPPLVAITSPQDGENHPEDMIELSIDIEATHGWPLRTVWLEINGQALPALEAGPYVYEGVVFPTGQYTLVAHAEDWSGVLGSSDPVALGVGDVPLGATTGTNSSGGSEDDGTSMADASTTSTSEPGATSEGGAEVPMEDQGGGCSCREHRPRSLDLALWLPVVLATTRRRQARHALNDSPVHL